VELEYTVQARADETDPPGAPAIAIVAALAHAVELHNGSCSKSTNP